MNVVLAMRHAYVRLALEVVLGEEPGLTVVGTVSETEGLLALTQTARPDLVVLEWGLPGRPIAALLAAVHTYPRPIAFLVLGHDPRLAQDALRAGAYAFLLVGDPPEALLATLRQARAALRR